MFRWVILLIQHSNSFEFQLHFVNRFDLVLSGAVLIHDWGSAGSKSNPRTGSLADPRFSLAPRSQFQFASRWTSLNCRQNAQSWRRSKKKSSSHSCSQTKCQKLTPIPNKNRHHIVVRTEIMCRMHRSRAPQLSWRPLFWKFKNLTPIQFSNPNLILGTSYFMPSVAGVFWLRAKS